jgi:hypothetical protein
MSAPEIAICAATIGTDGIETLNRHNAIGLRLMAAVMKIARMSASAIPPIVEAKAGAIWTAGANWLGAIRKARLPTAQRPTVKVTPAKTMILAISPAETPAAE